MTKKRLVVSLVVLAATIACGCTNLRAATTVTVAQCDSPTTMIETRDRHTSQTWVTPIEPFCPREYLLATSATLPLVNQRVVATLLEYPCDGRHDYFWPRKGELAYDGCTTDIFFAGQRVIVGEPRQRTFCSGLTLEVFYRVLGSLETVPPKFAQEGPAEVKRLWFCTAINAAGPAEAMEALGVGRRVPPEEAVAGDFVQIWRHNRTGHSVIFVAWATNGRGERVGMHYWSTQEGTHGIGFATEAVGPERPMIWLEQTSFARLLPPREWH